MSHGIDSSASAASSFASNNSALISWISCKISSASSSAFFAMMTRRNVGEGKRTLARDDERRAYKNGVQVKG